MTWDEKDASLRSIYDHLDNGMGMSHSFADISVRLNRLEGMVAAKDELAKLSQLIQRALDNKETAEAKQASPAEAKAASSQTGK